MLLSYKAVLTKMSGYFRENWSAPFSIGFILLLVVAAVSLSMGFAILADEVAIYAYYALVVGVVLQLVCFLKYNKKSGEKNNGSS
jgi:heme/copper-type cytochrome/quinol oxidase subunit 4